MVRHGNIIMPYLITINSLIDCVLNQEDGLAVLGVFIKVTSSKIVTSAIIITITNCDLPSLSP